KFASQYTNGRDMAVGFGGYYSICGTASRGPALGAISHPNPEQDTLELLPMMTYVDGTSACPRDGNYLSNIYWSTRPDNPWTGEWTGVDVARAGVFIDMPDKKGYVAFTRQGIGRIGYDYGGYNADGHYQDVWYFYNIADLGAVAIGDKDVTSVLPDTYSPVQYPISGNITSGACFDEETRMLYVYVMQSIPQQYGSKPIIHVYHLTEESDENVTLIDETFDQYDDLCFGAYQNIVVAGDGNTVEFESGSRVNLIAGNSIQFLPGTIIHEGANVHGYISTDSSLCAETFAESILIDQDKSISHENIETEKISNNYGIKDIIIYPNPNTGRFVVDFLQFKEKVSIVIHNSMGMLVYRNVLNPADENEIEIPNVQKGIYFIKAYSKEGIVAKKMIVN
nr:T9SS type A sorting domain-containing protein [Prolixibacteraceae bacterium]